MATSPATANLLRELRRKQGVSLRTAAADIGIAPSQLSRIERGQRSVAADLSERLSSYYGVSADLIKINAGRLPEDVIAILMQHPGEIDELRRKYAADSSTSSHEGDQ